jgi:hypothetical protein
VVQYYAALLCKQDFDQDVDLVVLWSSHCFVKAELVVKINDQFLSMVKIQICSLAFLAGFSEKRLVEAAEKQLNILPFYHSFWNRTSQPTLVLF